MTPFILAWLECI